MSGTLQSYTDEKTKASGRLSERNYHIRTEQNQIDPVNKSAYQQSFIIPFIRTIKLKGETHISFPRLD